MYYVYVLLSKKDNNFYVGFTQDLRKRIQEHTDKKVFSTKSRLPLLLIFYEAYISKSDAVRRERYLKTQKGRNTLEVMLKDYLSSIPR